jgi:hypothetical protein
VGEGSAGASALMTAPASTGGAPGDGGATTDGEAPASTGDPTAEGGPSTVLGPPNGGAERPLSPGPDPQPAARPITQAVAASTRA